MRWLCPPPTRTAYFCADRKARNRLAGIKQPAVRAFEKHGIRMRRGGSAGEQLQEIECGALAGQ